jgi:hypothetical protein
MFGLFVIEAGSEPVAVNDTEGKPIVFDNGTAAAACAVRIGNGDYWGNSYVPLKCQPRRLSSDAWKARELGRFADGTYIPLPWADLPAFTLTADHFAHVSTEDGAKIAYTQNAAKGQGDIQTRVRPGKYLTQFYSDVFDAPTIARLAAEFSNQYGESNVLLLATTADEIEHVYVNGPHSCMAHSADHFDSSVHPCRIYAAGDLAVAYMVRHDAITARALVWPDKKLHSRVYGDETRLGDLLELAGYTNGSLAGARMLRIEEHDGFVMPYVDNHGAEEAGEFLRLTRHNSDINVGNQNGLSGPGYHCSSCDCGLGEDDGRSTDDGELYCDDCYSERYGYCDHDQEDCDRDTMADVIVRRNARTGRNVTEWWGQNAQENHAFTCDGNGNMYHNDLRVELADGTEWSQEYFEDNGSICEGNGDAYASEDMVQLEDGTVWSKDYFTDNGVTVDGVLYAKGDEPTSDDEEDVEAPQSVVKPYRASPTFHCDAQLERALAPPSHLDTWRVAGPDSDGDYRIMRGPGEWSASPDNHYGFYSTLESACEALQAKQSLDACNACEAFADLVSA